MAKQIQLKGAGDALGTSSQSDILRALTQQGARVSCSGVAATTDNSTGVAGAAALSGAFVNLAASGSNLADKTTTEAAFAAIKNGVAVAAQKGNALATILGAVILTDNTGGTVTTPGTIPAATKSVTGAATGVQATELNASAAGVNAALYNLIRQANQIARAVGAAPIRLSGTGTVSNTLAAIVTAGGTAASPGVSKASVDAALNGWASILASLAVIYNAARTQKVLVRTI